MSVLLALMIHGIQPFENLFPVLALGVRTKILRGLWNVPAKAQMAVDRFIDLHVVSVFPQGVFNELPRWLTHEERGCFLGSFS